VISGAGGVGSLAVQLGHPMGAGRVIATASSQEKRDLTLELGADAAVDPDKPEEELTQAIIEANDGKPVDAVFEMAGGTLFDASLKALAPFGRMITYGISSRDQNEIRTGKLLKNSWSVIGFWLFHSLERPDELIREPVRDLYERAARGEVKAVTGGTWPLSEVRQAHEELKSRRTRGKLLLDTTA
jgi:NADPH:quinone reductase